MSCRSLFINWYIDGPTIVIIFIVVPVLVCHIMEECGFRERLTGRWGGRLLFNKYNEKEILIVFIIELMVSDKTISGLRDAQIKGNRFPHTCT